VETLKIRQFARDCTKTQLPYAGGYLELVPLKMFQSVQQSQIAHSVLTKAIVSMVLHVLLKHVLALLTKPIVLPFKLMILTRFKFVNGELLVLIMMLLP